MVPIEPMVYKYTYTVYTNIQMYSIHSLFRTHKILEILFEITHV